MKRRNLRVLAFASMVACAVSLGQRAQASITITAPDPLSQAIVFDKAVFTGPNWFYIGAQNSPTNLPNILAAKTFGLSRTNLVRSNGTFASSLKDITPQAVIRNTTPNETNPLNSANSAPTSVGVPVTNLTEISQLPLASRPIPWPGSDMDDVTGVPAQSKGTIVYETLPTDGSTIGCLNAKLGAEGGTVSFPQENYLGLAAQPPLVNAFTEEKDNAWVCAATAWTRSNVGAGSNGFGLFPLNVDKNTDYGWLLDGSPEFP